MHFHILTLFPEMFQGPFSSSIIKRAIDAGLVSINIRNIRDFTHDRHHTADDYAYGGGAGMVMKPGPVFEAVESVLSEITSDRKDIPVILMTPQGRVFNQGIAAELAGYEHLLLVCGHYEGVDERIREHLVTDEISIGDYVLSGGELPAMVLADAVARLVPGVLGSEESAADDSHASSLLEYPQYTRPPEYRSWQVPEVLISGNHAMIARWRREQAILRTLKRRPELLDKAGLTDEEKKLFEELTSPENEENR